MAATEGTGGHSGHRCGTAAGGAGERPGIEWARPGQMAERRRAGGPRYPSPLKRRKPRGPPGHRDDYSAGLGLGAMKAPDTAMTPIEGATHRIGAAAEDVAARKLAVELSLQIRDAAIVEGGEIGR